MAAIGELLKGAKKAVGIGTKKVIPKGSTLGEFKKLEEDKEKIIRAGKKELQGRQEARSSLIEEMEGGKTSSAPSTEPPRPPKTEGSKTTVPQEPTPAISRNGDMTEQVTAARTRGEKPPRETPTATPAKGVTGDERDPLTGAKSSGYEDIDYAPMGGEKKAASENTVPREEKTTQDALEKEEKSGGFFSRWRDKPNEFQQQTDQAIEDWQKQSGGSFNIGEIGEKRAEKAMGKRLTAKGDEILGDLRGAKNQEEYDKVLKDHGVEVGENQNTMDAIQDTLQKQAKKGPGMQDYFNGYHGPQLVAAGTIGASVLGMASSRGQQSNEDLYSNPF